jgi:hypothetical protein
MEGESKLRPCFESRRQQRETSGDVKFGKKGDVAFTGVAFTGVAFTRASSTSITLHDQSQHI